MHEKSAKKMGEVAAFAQVAIETIEKGRGAFEQVLGSGAVSAALERNLDHERRVVALAAAAGVSETVKAKTEATADKLRAMRDLYVKDEWENPAELLEWSGFFEGAAMVHWSLLVGVSKATGNIELGALAQEAHDVHREMLASASDALRTIGEGYEK